jgi:mannose-6-phosphate isomerase-like protein (cupin superfamily)
LATETRDGPPPHRHRGHDEYFFVLESTISLVVDGKESTVGPNTLAFVPRGTTHSFKNIGASTASCSSGPSRAKTSAISGRYTKWRSMAVSI